MTATHRTRAGSWAICEQPDTCDLKFHFPDMTIEEVKAVPIAPLLLLLEAVDPPSRVIASGVKKWLKSDGGLHREYDLPALIYPDGGMYWMQKALPHRDGDKPQSVHPDGTLDWYRNGERYASTDGHFQGLPPESWNGEIF